MIEGNERIDADLLYVRALLLQALLLDLDGTLIDTPQAIVDIAQATLAALGRDPLPAQQIRDTIGLALPVALGSLLGTGPAGASEAVEIYRVLWRAQVTPRIPHLLYPGVRDGLRCLSRAGLRLAVVTGKAQDGAEATVQAMGMADLFEVVLGYTSVPNPKPAPDLALEALRRLALPAAAALVVGDAHHDLLMANAAGVRAVACTWGAQPEEALLACAPAFVARSFPEVVRIALDLATLPIPL